MANKNTTGDKVQDERRRGFYIIDNHIIDDYGPNIGAYGVAVYSLIARYADGNGENAFPSYPTIAKQLGMSRTKVFQTIELLVELGLIRKENRVDNAGDLTSNLYSIVNLGSTPNVLGSTPHVLPSTQSEPQVVHHTYEGSTPHVPDQDTIIKTQNKKTSAKRQSKKSIADKPAEDDEQKRLVKQILDGYIEVRGKNGVNYGKEGAWAKRIAKEGATAEMVKACYLWLKKQPYWDEKVLPLATIYENLPEFKKHMEKRGISVSADGETRQRKVIKIYNQYTGQNEERVIG